MTIRIAIVGYGKIAEDQHVPAIRANSAFELVGVVGPRVTEGPGVPAFRSVAELKAAVGVDALAICTPPGPRHAIAADALAGGLHVLAEKPPTATLGEAQALERLAQAGSATLFTAWHAQHNAAVRAARDRLAGRIVTRLAIDWREDVRKWHPGQEWIWRPGGFGVFDPGINALSIATAILPMPLLLEAATLGFPANRQAPIMAELRFQGGDFGAQMDWRHAEGECWTIAVDTDDGMRLKLLAGGAVLEVDGTQEAAAGDGEYPALYARFAELVAAGQSEIDLEPLRIVADAFLLGCREPLAPFD
jgi:D-galactose 1-dehydrogenase